VGSREGRHRGVLRDQGPVVILVLGANGQLGLALRAALPGARFLGRQDFDLTDERAYDSFPFEDFTTVINASAYTAVDLAETPDGRRDAWATNVTALGYLATACAAVDATLVHVSSDYVFDGTAQHPYLENDPLCPLGVYGQTKAASDVVVATVSKHYIVRTSWVIGEGNNFVRTMASLAERGIAPSVVNDQVGRLTFTDDLARGIAHLLASDAPFGTYNLTNSGDPASWADVAAQVFALTGHDAARVTGVSTAQYYAGKDGIAPRPAWSVLDLAKIEAAGFSPPRWQDRLAEYVSSQS
jgi:dTDP-4-dehydrorhamnose reductase